jgi:hypothetical protein
MQTQELYREKNLNWLISAGSMDSLTIEEKGIYASCVGTGQTWNLRWKNWFGVCMHLGDVIFKI